jgi:hypothetical protein
MRIWISSALLTVAAFATLAWHNGAHWFLVAMAGMFLISAGVIHLRSQIAMLLARGASWSCVTISVMAAQLFSAEAHAANARAAMLTACAGCLALLLTGRRHQTPSSFHPKAHSKILTLGLTLAIADVVALNAFACGALLNSDTAHGLSALAAAFTVGLGAFGLFRLQTWGFVLSVLVNLTIASTMLADALHFREIRIVFLIPALVQLLLYLPVLFALLRQRELQMPAWLHKIAMCIPATALVVMMALALQPLTGRPIFETVYRWLQF